MTSSVGDIGGMINNAVGSAVSGAVSSTMPKLPAGLNPAGIRGDLGLAFDGLVSSGQTITTVIMPNFSGVGRQHEQLDGKSQIISGGEAQ